MIKTKNVLDEIHFLLVDSIEEKSQYSCKIMSAVFASFIVDNISKCFIIDSKNHSVVYDGIDTWDLSLGIVFKKYKYPDLNIPNPIIIEKFKNWYSSDLFNRYYSNKALQLASKNLTIKEIKKLGVIDGTKKT